MNGHGPVAAVKLVALLTFRDEAPFLPAWLASVTRLVDEVVALDDRSTDGGGQLVRAAGGQVVPVADHPDADGFSARRQVLLELGRQAGGTHFLCLDADEVPSASFLRDGRRLLDDLAPGSSLAVEQVNLWRSTTCYRRGWRYRRPLALAFRDQRGLEYDYATIHESRIPRAAEVARRSLPPERAAILHLQFVAWHRAQVKQAWYRARELLDGRPAAAVNARYWFTLDTPAVRRRPLPPAWVPDSVDLAAVAAAPPSWHLDELLRWFDERGPAFFEPLQIWHVAELAAAFRRAEGRQPRRHDLHVPIVVAASEVRDLVVGGARRARRTVAR